jgi:putative nucleotidyltransferase with HDIG domain
MDRPEAWELVTLHTASESLRRHMLGVEACMRWYAERQGEDVESWGLAGLLHDFDYEEHPDEHPLWGIERLRELGTAEAVVEAVAAHYPEKTGVQPVSPMARHLVACDELTGFVFAVAYVRPSKSVMDLEPASVRKKMKSASFAAAVDRGHLLAGAELIGVPFDEHVANVIEALRARAELLGLCGTGSIE